jgi:hypothetical protein
MSEIHQKKLISWMSRCRIAQHAQYSYSGQLKNRNLMLGLFIILTSSISGTTAFASIDPGNALPVLLANWSINPPIFVGAMSVFSVVLASLQTFLSFPERAERHRISAIKFSALKKHFELHIGIPFKSDGEYLGFMSKAAASWDAINQECPLPPRGLFKKHFDKMGGEKFFTEIELKKSESNAQPVSQAGLRE